MSELQKYTFLDLARREGFGDEYYCDSASVDARLALMQQLSSELLAMVRRYARDCSECCGTGRHSAPEGASTEFEACPDCVDARKLIAKAIGEQW